MPIVALTGMPSHYVRAMHELNAGRVLASILDDKNSLLEILEEFDHAASCINWRFVLCVEDLERLDTSERFLGTVRALLFKLDRLHSVTVIVATTSLSLGNFDVDKIARFVERIPPMPKEHVGQILSCFLRGCREQLTRSGLVDSARHDNGTDIGLFLPDASRPEDWKQLGTMRNGVGLRRLITDELVDLCSTPRALKMSLRQCDEAWGTLTGEVDLEQLLVFSLMRVGWPELFTIVNDNLDELRKDGVADNSSRSQESAFQRSFDTLKLDKARKEAAIFLVSFLFPSPHSAERRERLQGVHLESPADYWNRMSVVPELRPEERDQPHLKAWSAGDRKGLLTFVEREAGQERFAHFAYRDQSDLCVDLLVDYVKMLADGLAKSDYHGVFRALRTAISNSRIAKFGDDHRLVKQLTNCVSIAENSDLGIIESLESIFCGRDSVLTPEEHEQMRTTVRKASVKALTASPVRIGLLVTNKERWFLFSLLERTERPPAPEEVAKGVAEWVSETEGWQGCVDALFVAAREMPEVVLVQIADMVYRHSSQQPVTQYLKATAEVLFGHEGLMDLVRSIPIGSFPKEPICDQLRELAQNTTSASD